jgi:outer membrane protein W
VQARVCLKALKIHAAITLEVEVVYIVVKYNVIATEDYYATPFNNNYNKKKRDGDGIIAST